MRENTAVADAEVQASKEPEPEAAPAAGDPKQPKKEKARVTICFHLLALIVYQFLEGFALCRLYFHTKYMTLRNDLASKTF